jgi:hypothetical protein
MGKVQLKVETLLWGKPAESKAERRLLMKLDAVILSYVCLSCEWSARMRCMSLTVVRFHKLYVQVLAIASDTAIPDSNSPDLDRANLANAYVSGMREAVGCQYPPTLSPSAPSSTPRWTTLGSLTEIPRQIAR